MRAIVKIMTVFRQYPLLPPRAHKDTSNTTSDTAIILETVHIVDVDIG